MSPEVFQTISLIVLIYLAGGVGLAEFTRRFQDEEGLETRHYLMIVGLWWWFLGVMLWSLLMGRRD